MSPLAPSLFALALVSLAACGPRARTNEAAARAPVVDGPPMAANLDVQLTDDVRFALRVTNNAARKLELTFPSGLTHDVAVLDESGREVWRWSEGRLFTQGLRNHLLGARETRDYTAAWDPGDAHGTFIAVASFNSETFPAEQRVRFTIP